MSEPATIPEAVAAAWRACEETWDEQARHEALFVLVSQHCCFAWAAARYREHAGDAIAERMQDRLRRAATATMLATAARRETSSGSPYRLTILLLVVFVIAALAGLAYVSSLRIHSSPPPRPPTPAPR